MTAQKNNSPSSSHVRVSSKPIGEPTRGKTAPNRLRRSDIFLSLYAPEFLRNLPGVYIDLGFGASPVTPLETWRRFQRNNPSFRLIGVEIDPERVRTALPFANPLLDFREGGFNLPVQAGESIAIIRAMNVLRQYSEEDYIRSLQLLGVYLAEDGILLEGTSDPLGRLMVCNLYRNHAGVLNSEGLVFSLRTYPGFLPTDFQAVLPKNIIHHAEPGSTWETFFQRWQLAWRQSSLPASQALRQTAGILESEYGYRVDKRERFLRRGFLLLKIREGLYPVP